MSRTRAMILAAGLGTRLRPLTDRRPKALLPVGGKPLIDYAVEILVRSDVTEIIVNLHHLGDQIREHLGDGGRFGARVLYSEEDPLLGSGGGIAHARQLLDGDDFVTLNADTIIDVDVGDVLRFHRKHGATATMVLRKDRDMGKYGLVQIDEEGRIGRFLQHRGPRAQAPLDPYMFSGLQVLSPKVFAFMQDGAAFSMTQRTYPAMLAAGEALYGYPFGGHWLTVGTPEELQAAERWFLQHDG